MVNQYAYQIDVLGSDHLLQNKQKKTLHFQKSSTTHSYKVNDNVIIEQNQINFFPPPFFIALHASR